ncbi:hypothetical protein YC2023_071491 [Brassica napus]
MVEEGAIWFSPIANGHMPRSMERLRLEKIRDETASDMSVLQGISIARRNGVPSFAVVYKSDGGVVCCRYEPDITQMLGSGKLINLLIVVQDEVRTAFTCIFAERSKIPGKPSITAFYLIKIAFKTLLVAVAIRSALGSTLDIPGEHQTLEKLYNTYSQNLTSPAYTAKKFSKLWAKCMMANSDFTKEKNNDTSANYCESMIDVLPLVKKCHLRTPIGSFSIKCIQHQPLWTVRSKIKNLKVTVRSGLEKRANFEQLDYE